MSKVQSPKSSSVPNAVIERRGQRGDEDSKSDLGPWTLDLGLCVTDLRKSFSSPSGETIEVLRGVSFEARPGETIAITGASGAGKSTLLHLIGGLETPDHGSVRLGQFEIERARPAALAGFRNTQMGLIFQFHHLLGDLTAAENVALPLMIARENRAATMKEALRALEQVGLAARADHPVAHLSGGEQQRVAACRALIGKPSLVLADEPTGNLDASYGVELGEILVSYARSRPAIVVIATHNESLAQLCDRILVLNEGRVSEHVYPR